MNMIAAANETVWYVDGYLRSVAEAGDACIHERELYNKLPESMQLPHLKEMVKLMGGEGFSEGKLGRWLGWVQASACAIRALTLEQCKEINKSWAE